MSDSVVYFCSPPGWPSAAPGILPPARWQPDPSFPAPPAGWVFYRNAAGFPVQAPSDAWCPPTSVSCVSAIPVRPQISSARSGRTGPGRTGPGRTGPGRAAVAVGVVVSLVLAAVIGSSVFLLVTNRPGDSASGTVGSSGFVLNLAGVTVRASAGVAPEGTPVSAELIEAPSFGEFGGFAAPVARGVDITLGDRMQPLSPVTIIFDVAEDDWDNTRLFLLGESRDEGRDIEFVKSTRDGTERTVTAIAQHLSWYSVAKVDQRQLGEKFGEWIDVASGIRTTKPACVDEPNRLSGSYTFAAPWPDSAWVCTTETAEDVTVTLKSNSGLVFEVTSTPRARVSDPRTLNSAGLATAAAALQMKRSGLLKGDGVLVAGGELSITYPKPFESAHITMRVSPVLTQVSTLAWGGQMLLPDEWSTAIDWWNCVADAVDGAVGGGSGEQFAAAVGCAATSVGDVAGELLGMIADAPGKLATQFEGAGKELTGSDVEEFDAYLVSKDAVRSISWTAKWLYELPNMGGSTSGNADIALVQIGDAIALFPLSTNQWIGCDGNINTVVYELDGKWSTLNFAFALQSHTPRGLMAEWSVQADGRGIYSSTTRPGDPLERIELDVKGVQRLQFSAQTRDACATASKGYGALVQGYVGVR